MAMTDKNRVDHDLAGFFEAAHRAAPEPSPDLLARVLADAGRAQADQAARVIPRPSARVARWRQFVDVLGGWPAMAGLVSAGVAGLWLGINPPDMLSVLPLAGFDASDEALIGMMPGVDLDLLALEEG